MKKVLVIGLDGLEPKIVEPMLHAGELPHLARLRESGGYSRLGTTYPAQTPVAWSTFSTGTNPGGHGIYDFLGRDPLTYLPLLALSRYEQKSAFVPPKVVNGRGGTPFWQLLTQAGIASTVIRCPCTYPPDPIKGRMLAGVGVPDLRGSLGMATFYSSDPAVLPGQSEKAVAVRLEKGKVETHLIGPRNPKTKEDITFDLHIELDPVGQKAILKSDGSPAELVLQSGQWSDWLKVRFKSGMLQSVRGMLRFYLRQLDPVFELYASPINFDPEAPLFPISAPQEYAGELQARLGPYYTLGMAEDHDGLINGRIDEAAYLEQCDLVLRDRRRMMLSELDRFSEGFFFCLYDTPDRLAHMFWRFREPEHPANQGNSVVHFQRAIEEHYRALDGIVGKAMKYVDDDTLMIVLSDHGMNSFQRGLNLNTWLWQNGFLKLKAGVQPGDDQGDEFFRHVDWSATQAYALGLGGIYLNVRGREAEGIIPGAETHVVAEAIVRGLTGLRDEQKGQTAVLSVLSKEKLYTGPFLDQAPDLLVNFAEGYRVSWSTPLGGTSAGLFEDNRKRWGGDHVIDPSLVPGVLFMNRPFRGEEARMLDLAPTILTALGVPKGQTMEGQSLVA